MKIISLLLASMMLVQPLVQAGCHGHHKRRCRVQVCPPVQPVQPVTPNRQPAPEVAAPVVPTPAPVAEVAAVEADNSPAADPNRIFPDGPIEAIVPEIIPSTEPSRLQRMLRYIPHAIVSGLALGLGWLLWNHNRDRQQILNGLNGLNGQGNKPPVAQPQPANPEPQPQPAVQPQPNPQNNGNGLNQNNGAQPQPNAAQNQNPQQNAQVNDGEVPPPPPADAEPEVVPSAPPSAENAGQSNAAAQPAPQPSQDQADDGEVPPAPAQDAGQDVAAGIKVLPLVESEAGDDNASVASVSYEPAAQAHAVPAVQNNQSHMDMKYKAYAEAEAQTDPLKVDSSVQTAPSNHVATQTDEPALSASHSQVQEESAAQNDHNNYSSPARSKNKSARPAIQRSPNADLLKENRVLRQKDRANKKRIDDLTRIAERAIQLTKKHEESEKWAKQRSEARDAAVEEALQRAEKVAAENLDSQSKSNGAAAEPALPQSAPISADDVSVKVLNDQLADRDEQIAELREDNAELRHKVAPKAKHTFGPRPGKRYVSDSLRIEDVRAIAERLKKGESSNVNGQAGHETVVHSNNGITVTVPNQNSNQPNSAVGEIDTKLTADAQPDSPLLPTATNGNNQNGQNYVSPGPELHGSERATPSPTLTSSELPITSLKSFSSKNFDALANPTTEFASLSPEDKRRAMAELLNTRSPSKGDEPLSKFLGSVNPDDVRGLQLTDRAQEKSWNIHMKTMGPDIKSLSDVMFGPMPNLGADHLESEL